MAAQASGVEVPHYCYHDGLSIPANCRICLAECWAPDARNDGKLAPFMGGKLLPTCQTGAVDGMVVRTDSPKAVANQTSATVSIIDMETDEVVGTVDLQSLGFTANAKPHHVAVEPDGSHWYVSLIADGWVLKFTRDNELVGQAEFETPGMLALDANRGLLYVGRSMAAVSPPQRIGVIRTADMTIEEKIGQMSQVNAGDGDAIGELGDLIRAGRLGSVLNLVDVEAVNEL